MRDHAKQFPLPARERVRVRGAVDERRKFFPNYAFILSSFSFARKASTTGPIFPSMMEGKL